MLPFRHVLLLASVDELRLEDDDGIQWFSIVSVTDGDGKDLVPDLGAGEHDLYDEIMEPLQNLASDLFVTPDFCASWVTLEVYAWIPEQEA